MPRDSTPQDRTALESVSRLCALRVLAVGLFPGFDSSDVEARRRARNGVVELTGSLYRWAMREANAVSGAPPAAATDLDAPVARDVDRLPDPTSQSDSVPRPSMSPAPSCAPPIKRQKHQTLPLETRVNIVKPFMNLNYKFITMAAQAEAFGITTAEVSRLVKLAKKGRSDGKTLRDSLEPKRRGRKRKWSSNDVGA